VFGLITEIAITVSKLDLAGMLAVGGCPVGVLAHAAWIGDGELRGQVPEDALRPDWVAEEQDAFTSEGLSPFPRTRCTMPAG